MNARFIIAVAIVSVLSMMSSCSNDEDQTNQSNAAVNESEFSRTPAENQILYDSIIAIEDLEVQKITVSSFDVDTQAALWQLKFANYLNNNALTSGKISFINSLISFYTASNLYQAQVNRNQSILNQANSFRQQAINIFGANEGRYLLERFENTNQTLSKQPNVISAGPIRACDCSSSSSCYRLTGVSIWGLSWEYGTCGGGCYVQTYFFGFIESSNTGRCSY